MTFLEFCRRYVCEFDADDVVDVVIDLKVLVKSFYCEDRSCYAGNPRERLLCEFAKDIYLFRESWILWIIIIVYSPAC